MSSQTASQRDAALELLRTKAQKMSEHLRTLPTIPFENNLLSYNDAIREVSNNTDLGKRIITSLVPQ
jgi:hypothetical protein